MYKISQVAEILNVPTIHIHEKLIFLKKDLKECIHKKSGITYIDDKGMVVLKKAFESEISEKSHVFDDDKVINVDEVDSNKKDIQTNKLSKIENTYDLKVLELKEKIGQSKSEISKLDFEIKRLDEAFYHYQSILKDDIEWRITEEDKIELASINIANYSEVEENVEYTEKSLKKSLFNALRNKWKNF